jgi:hypothetical protein
MDLTDILEKLPVGCNRFYEDNKERFRIAPGSASKHQAWAKGYCDHLLEVSNIAVCLYKSLGELRPLPFTLEQVLLVLFLHDIEKLFKYENDHGPIHDLARIDPTVFKRQIISRYGISLSPLEWNALEFIHGENERYSQRKRVIQELGAFCHCCDFLSSRLWFDEPKKSGYLDCDPS